MLDSDEDPRYNRSELLLFALGAGLRLKSVLSISG